LIPFVQSCSNFIFSTSFIFCHSIIVHNSTSF
jgi:hypothetical protein